MKKINRTYIDSDFTYLNNLLGVNFINYQALQNLLTGRTFVPVNDKDFTLTQNAQGYNLKSIKPAGGYRRRKGFFIQCKV